MCGIVGVFNVAQPVSENLLRQQVEALRHRGPDDQGVYVSGTFGMGMRRLSIIDPVGGYQPMSNEDGTLWIVCNGEIYNYRTLRHSLIAKGHQFRTESDTEVIIHAYEEWGPDCLNRLNGMFAFALWNEQTRTLFLARDRLGINPLYYFKDNERLIFASEIKAILADPTVPREIDARGLNNYFTFGHAVAPHTIYRGIRKLLPGHYMLIQGELTDMQLHCWWDVPLDVTDDPKSEDEYAHEIRELLEDSVRLRLVSDVPVGAFLSGGVDSSAIVGLMSRLMNQPVQTFSVGFDVGRGYNELSDARRVAEHFGTDHHELHVQHSDLVEALTSLVYHYDEPFGDAAGFPTYLVSRLASKHVKVALTGEGSDELFGGYRRYVVDRLAPLYQTLPTFLRERVIARCVRSLPRFRRIKKIVEALSVPEPDIRYGTWLTAFDDDLKLVLFQEHIADLTRAYDAYDIYHRYYYRDENAEHLNRLMYVDVKTWLADTYLEKTDKASMAVSLEARVPFLDHRLVELALRIPSRYKIRGISTKRILKRAMADLLPLETLRKRKHGFSVPTDAWFRGSLRDFVFEILMDARTRQRGLFNPSAIEQLWHWHQSGKEVVDTHLWLLLNFELWARTYLDGDSSV